MNILKNRALWASDDGTSGGGTPTPPAALTSEPPAIPPAPEPAPAGDTLGGKLYGGKPAEPDPGDIVKPEAAPTAEPPVAAAAPAPEGAPKEPTAEPVAPEPAVALTAESYKDLALPEGIEVNDELFGEAKALFAAQGIKPEEAPKLLGFYKKALEQQAQASVEALRVQNEKWAKELDTLPEFQGERRAQAAAVIGRAIEEFGSAEVRTTLDQYGLGNNPALAKFIYSMANAMIEGTGVPTGQPALRKGAGGRTLGSKLYGSTS